MQYFLKRYLGEEICNLSRCSDSISCMAMATSGTLEIAKRESWTDLEIVERVRAGDTALYEIIMRRYNQRLYRVARAILRDDAEAEDVMQDAYVRAYQHLHQFAGSAQFSTWLTRIAVNEALHRLRMRNRERQLEDVEDNGDASMNMARTSLDPEQRASIAELGHLLEEAVLDLPEQYRVVVMLRDIEELSTAETAAALDLSEENVKVRLHRGHSKARSWLFERVGSKAKDAFPFMGARCDRVVDGVFARLGELGDSQSQIQ
ncbi:MAG: RNA polymerase sigma factor [Silvibacterium sp.]